MHRIILHIDFDSFFASVAQEDHPEFRGKPLGVTAHNGRTAIIAASREAKKMGVKNVMRTYDAYKLCPDLLLTSADFHRYWEISKIFINICKDFSPYVEVFSIDELFLDVTLTAHLFGGVHPLIKKLKTRVSHEIGPFITVSVGIAGNKMLAKMASGLKKPDGVFEVRDDRLEQVFAIAKLQDICGIGPRIEARLQQMGITTLLRLRQAPLPLLVAEFGDVAGHFLYNVGQGKDTAPVRSFTQVDDVKSVGRNYCLPHNEYDTRIVLQNVYELCEEVCLKLRRLNKKARRFGIGLRGTHDLYGHTLRTMYSYQARDMFYSCLQVIKRYDTLFTEGYTRQLSVWASHLQDTDKTTMSLFPHERRWDDLSSTLDTINEKFGNHTIRNGFLLYADKLTTAPNGFMADKYERLLLSKTPQENPVPQTREVFYG
ncbi:MAG: hypothetical protein RLZZ455_171 [Candidatus Parcubacteria bacterium]|jgi:nucleotidyltransferase/DNA polymerase involved in DNA repair